MFRPGLSCICLILATLLWFVPGHASAGFCPPVANTVYVGDTALDNQCDYDSIQAAIDAAQCPTTIAITTQRTWAGQHLNIVDKSLVLKGTAEDGCGMVTNPGITQSPTGWIPQRVALSGIAGADESVITIRGNSQVTLQNLLVYGGRMVPHASGDGGGISFVGSGALTLENIMLSNNRGRYGGGIAMIAFNGPAVLRVRDHTLIHDNIAEYSGGGVALANGARLELVEPETTISYNEARGLDADGAWFGGEGGGVYIYGAEADIGAPGFAPPPFGGTEFTPVINHNVARWGGGIAVRANDSGNIGRLRFFTTGFAAPAEFSANSATAAGGALRVSSGGVACLFNANLLDNAAAQGFAVSLDGGRLFVNADPHNLCNADNLPDLGAGPCPEGHTCNLVARNTQLVAQRSTLRSFGSLVESVGGELYAERLAIMDNDAASAILANAGGMISLHNCLLTANSFYAAFSMDGTPLDVDLCTIADNQIHGLFNATITSNADITLTRSIVHQAAGDLLLYIPPGSSPTLDIHHLLSSDFTTLPSQADIITGDPMFVDAASGNYRLQPNSPALDFAPGSEGKDFDLRPRQIDLPYDTNQFGPVDLGAYEFQLPGYTSDTLFYHGFEILLPPTLE